MEFLQNWIIGVCAASIIFAAVHALAPDGPAKRSVRLAGGACVLIAVCAPISEVDFSALTFEAFAVSDEYAEAAEEVERENYELVKVVIEGRLRAYILDKADALGVTCEAEVSTVNTDGVPLPASVKGSWSGDAEAFERLCELIALDLGIPRTAQSWTEREE